MIGKIIALLFLLLSFLLIYPALSGLAEHGADGRLMLAASAVYLILLSLIIVMIVGERWLGRDGGWDGEELDGAYC